MDDLYHRQLLQAKRQFGASRFELGRLLHHIKERQLWRGKAKSFAEYLEAERINPSAARQYMKVAKTFIIELRLDETKLRELFDVNMGTLELAAKVINANNADEVLAKLASLSERDAKYELQRMGNTSELDAGRRTPEVARLLSQFRELPHELQIEAMNQLTQRSTEKPPCCP